MDSLSIGERLRPCLDVHAVFAIRCNEPFDGTAELLQRLLRRGREGVRDVDEQTLGKLDGGAAPSDGNPSEAFLSVSSNSAPESSQRAD